MIATLPARGGGFEGGLQLAENRTLRSLRAAVEMPKLIHERLPHCGPAFVQQARADGEFRRGGGAGWAPAGRPCPNFAMRNRGIAPIRDLSCHDRLFTCVHVHLPTA